MDFHPLPQVKVAGFRHLAATDLGQRAEPASLPPDFTLDPDTMQIELFPPLPAYLLERLLPFNTAHNGQDWELLYRSVSALSSAHPDKVFDSSPYSYVDLRGGSCGLLFVERHSGELYYVYEDAQ